jgi:hypothetical protein
VKNKPVTLNSSRKIKIIALTVTIIAVAITYYFITHYPVGTFTYAPKNGKDLTIKIKVSEDLFIFQDPIYTMNVTIKQNDHIYRKRYQTSDNRIFFALLKRNKKEFVVINDPWQGYIKCENGECGEFFQLEDKSYGVNPSTNDTTYFRNYNDTLKADTLSHIQFIDSTFTKLK